MVWSFVYVVNFLFKPLPWHIQTIGQLLSFEIVKDLKSIRFFIFGNVFCNSRQCMKFLTCFATNSIFLIFKWKVTACIYNIYIFLTISHNCCFQWWNPWYLREQGVKEKEINDIWKHLLSSWWNWTIQTFILQLFQGYSWLH